MSTHNICFYGEIRKNYPRIIIRYFLTLSMSLGLFKQKMDHVNQKYIELLICSYLRNQNNDTCTCTFVWPNFVVNSGHLLRTSI